MNDAELSRRVAYVHNDLALAPAFTVQWVGPDTWDRPAFIEGAGVHFPMGFTPPVPVGTGTVVTYRVFACAEVLVGQTDDLTTADYFNYVAALRAHLHAHIVESHEGLVGEELEAAVMLTQHTLVNDDAFMRLWDRSVRG